jgi:Fe2+ or Zn2+ uptake regulation protein
MINVIIDKLKEKGYRITPQRRLIAEKIVNATSVLTATEIWQAVREQFCDIGLDTVYRNLNMLVDLGIVTAIMGIGKEGARYELVCVAHHHHIVCVKCGQTICLDYCPINQQFLAMIRLHGYELIRHNMELFGLCNTCKVN